jgi:hypothetical protein
MPALMIREDLPPGERRRRAICGWRGARWRSRRRLNAAAVIWISDLTRIGRLREAGALLARAGDPQRRAEVLPALLLAAVRSADRADHAAVLRVIRRSDRLLAVAALLDLVRRQDAGRAAALTEIARIEDGDARDDTMLALLEADQSRGDVASQP